MSPIGGPEVRLPDEVRPNNRAPPQPSKTALTAHVSPLTAAASTHITPPKVDANRALLDDVELNPTVRGFTVTRCVVRNRNTLAESNRTKPVGLNVPLNQSCADRVGAALRQVLIVPV
jgi:hypothetical protein